jgi:hypothetical protein
MSARENCQRGLRPLHPPQKSLALLLLGDVQEDLEDVDAVLGQVPLVIVDLAAAVLPQALRRLRREPLVFELVGVNALADHVLIVGAVEDAHLSARRQRRADPPEVVVSGLLLGHLLELLELTSAHVEARQREGDRLVLAGGVHTLQQEQQSVGAVCHQDVLRPREALRRSF